MAYGNLSRQQAADAIDESPGTLDRICGKKGKETRIASWDQLWALADAARMPREFFSADFERLGEVVPPAAPKFDLSHEQREAARRRMADRLRALAQQRDARPVAEPDTKPARRRRRGRAS